LEYSIERSFRRVFGQDLMSTSIYNLRPDETNPAVPYLFLNATEVQSGRRFVVTPLSCSRSLSGALKIGIGSIGTMGRR